MCNESVFVQRKYILFLSAILLISIVNMHITFSLKIHLCESIHRL
jgi:hypothetical protein